MALCLPTLKLFKQKHNPFKTLQPCARSSSSCTSSSFLTSLFSLRLKPLFVFICLYLSLFVFICLYLFLFVFICLYLSLFVFNLSLFVFICQNLPILSNKPCRSNPCCSGSVQTANESEFEDVWKVLLWASTAGRISTVVAGDCPSIALDQTIAAPHRSKVHFLHALASVGRTIIRGQGSVRLLVQQCLW